MLIWCTWNFTNKQIIIIAIVVEKEIVGLSLQRILRSKKRTSFSRGNLGRHGVIWAGMGYFGQVYLNVCMYTANVVFTSLFYCITRSKITYQTQSKQSLITMYCHYNFRCLDIAETTVMSAWQIRNAIEKALSLKLPCTFIKQPMV